MLVKDVIHVDFVNYKKPCMYIAMPFCNFKCCREAGVEIDICQNSPIANQPTISISEDELVSIYIKSPITKAVVFCGLEPMESFDEILLFIKKLRLVSNDDVVIYTGYYEDEIQEKIELLSNYQNIIIKFGRYKAGQKQHFDKILGVFLANDEQYEKKIS